ncbi:hypothetical protein STCU_05952, partial [Strigomonas culicis]
MQIEKDYPPLSLLMYLQSAPPAVIFSAFQADCVSRGLEWYSIESQRIVLEYCLRHPVSKRYPPRYTTLRSFLKQYMGSIESSDLPMQDLPDGEDPVLLELMEAYIGLSIKSSEINYNMCYKSFFNPYIQRRRSTRRTSVPYLRVNYTADEAGDSNLSSPFHSGSGAFSSSLAAPRPPPGTSSNPRSKHTSRELSPNQSFPGPDELDVPTGAGASATADDKEAEKARRRAEKRDILSMFCPIRVSTQQLSNVGLSLWPAAFVLVQFLAQELLDTSRVLQSSLFPMRGGAWTGDEEKEPPLPPSDRLNWVELGAGAGLTPALLHHIPAYRRHVHTFTLTDYQDTIIENIRYNLQENHVCHVHDYVAAMKGLEGSQVAPPFHHAMSVDWRHPEVYESLLHEWPVVDLVLAADCIYDPEVIEPLVRVIETTMTTTPSSSFYRHTRQVPRDRCCLIVQTHRQDSTMAKFFNLVRPTMTIESFSIVRRPIHQLRDALSANRDGRDGGCIPLGEWANTAGAAGAFEDPDHVVCALQPDEVLPDGALRSLKEAPAEPHPPAGTTATVAGSSAFADVDTQLMSAGSMGTLPHVDMEQLLKDEMIGPFYTPMAGLIGVHVLRLRSEGHEDIVRPPSKLSRAGAAAAAAAAADRGRRRSSGKQSSSGGSALPSAGAS